MPYRSPVAEYKFVLAHVVGFEDVSSTETFAEATPDTVDAILTEVASWPKTSWPHSIATAISTRPS